MGDAALPPGLERLKPVERESQTIRNAGYNIGLDFQTFTQRCKLVPEDIKCDQKLGGCISEVVRQLLFHIQGIGHDNNATRLECPPEGDNRLGQIGQHDGDTISVFQPVFTQGGGKLLGLVAQLRIGHVHVFKNNGLPLAELLCSSIKVTGQKAGHYVESLRGVAVKMCFPGDGR